MAVGEGNVCPLRVGLAVPVGIDEILCEEATLQHVLLVLLGIEHLGDLGDRLVRPLEVIADLALSCLTLLRGDQHHAVTSLSTIDSGRGGILQDFHRGDDTRIKPADVIQTNTIYDIKGLRTYIRGITAHTYGR